MEQNYARSHSKQNSIKLSLPVTVDAHLVESPCLKYLEFVSRKCGNNNLQSGWLNSVCHNIIIGNLRYLLNMPKLLAKNFGRLDQHGDHTLFVFNLEICLYEKVARAHAYARPPTRTHTRKRTCSEDYQSLCVTSIVPSFVGPTGQNFFSHLDGSHNTTTFDRRVLVRGKAS